MTWIRVAVVSTSIGFCAACGGAEPEDSVKQPQAMLPTTYSALGSIDMHGEFFQSYGTNGRACSTCHNPADGFSITPRTIQALYESCADDPAAQADAAACAIFRTNDGSNSPIADVSTEHARRNAYSLLLSRGLIRVTASVPANADVEVIDVDDPYGYATPTRLSLYRRPLPATNLAFVSSVMWDLRETSRAPVPPPFEVALSLRDQLKSQASNATTDHSETMETLSDTELEPIVDFETSLFSAQAYDAEAGSLSEGGARGGPVALSKEPVPERGQNVMGFPSGFTSRVFTLFDAWANAPGGDAKARKRRSIARGQALFNERRAPGIAGSQFFDPNVTTCSECHSAFNIGTNSVAAPLSQGAEPSAVDYRGRDLPLYTLRCSAAGVAADRCEEGQTLQTTDPGRGLITGQWRVLNAFKVPSLRDVASRPPYFHNGAAATLEDVVDRYKQKMGFEFTEDEKTDLVNFLKAL